MGQNPGHADRHRPLGLSPGPAFPRLSRGQPASNPEVRPDFCPTYSFQLPALTAALRLAFSAERVGQDLPVHAFGVGRGLEPALADHLELSPAKPGDGAVDALAELAGEGAPQGAGDRR